MFQFPRVFVEENHIAFPKPTARTSNSQAGAGANTIDGIQGTVLSNQSLSSEEALQTKRNKFL